MFYWLVDKDVSYADIKQYVHNSINYSFIQNENKKQLLKDLDSHYTLRPISFKIDQMNIKLIAIGKTDNKALQTLIDDYTKRLSFTSNSNSIYPTLRTKKLIWKSTKERRRIILANYPTDQLILLDENGKITLVFSEELQKKMNSGKTLVFVIEALWFLRYSLCQSTGKISLSLMTFSHQMVRLFFYWAVVSRLYNFEERALSSPVRGSNQWTVLVFNCTINLQSLDFYRKSTLTSCEPIITATFSKAYCKWNIIAILIVFIYYLWLWNH
jgi:23S rRNA (pseudouridine1915-N3)-methyltransferase